MAIPQELTIRKYWTLIGINASSHAIRAAREVGLFQQLLTGQKTFGELVDACDIQPNLATRILDVLVATGLIERYAEHYAASQTLGLLAQYDADLGDHYLDSLVDQLRCDLPAGSGDAFRRHQVARGWTRTPLAMQAAAVLEIGQKRRDLRILEIGCGSGVWTSTLAFRDPGTTIIAVDHADALAEAKKMIESIDLQDRWTGFEADPTSGELPEGPFDLVVIPELLQTIDDALAVTILGRAADVTRPGGEVAVIDFFDPIDPKERSLATAVQNLELGLRTPLGRLKTAPEVSQFMVGAGLTSALYATLNNAPQNAGLLLATRPETLN
ncbi:protein-L-isoaspartate O-methyltransferase [Rosistilla carotiformis]|uniref:Protein-L-isoaspartate O-methyltransferase n=1 Tax=Rosistilla carotiformis TaxID=2528017 RepID=A0A518JQC9_9BACT|nr:class I SAM-dependent methyltransferase [Rosistilla carotiformis]QDV67750.1 protein-L-isoaspartate O-methyltransferase [Rosistilla carotiformis]